MLRSLSFEVFGKVQGVFFRKHTQSMATKLNLVGWVMNTKHQTVVGCIQGHTDQVVTMKSWLQTEGSPKSIIERCEFKDDKNIEKLEYSDFEIRKKKNN